MRSPLVSSTGAVVRSAGQFYNVFYMTGQEYDVVVVGSGGAGMVAALAAAHQGLSTVVVEKAAHFGGSTARSGGGVWIPNNEILKRDGVTDTPEAARNVPARDHRRRRRTRAHRHLSRPRPRDAVLRAEELAAEDVLGARLLRLLPGAAGRPPGGRSVEPKPFNAKKLGAELNGLEPPYGKAPLNVVVMQQDYVRLNQLKRHPRGVLRSLKVGVAHDVGQGDRQEAGRHGPRADRAAAHGPAGGRRPGSAEHRADRPVRRGRRGRGHLRPRHERPGIG